MQQQQREAEHLLHDKPASSAGASAARKASAPVDYTDLTPAASDHVPARPPLLQRQSSVSTELSAYLPPLSVTGSELEAVLSKPLVDWDNNDVIEWLQAVDLERLTSSFSQHAVTGKQLCEVSMELLDQLAVTSLDDRQLLLSQLYELQRPGQPSLEQLLRRHSSSTHSAASAANSQPSSHSVTSLVQRSGVSASPPAASRTAMRGRASPWTPGSIRRNRCK